MIAKPNGLSKFQKIDTRSIKGILSHSSSFSNNFWRLLLKKNTLNTNRFAVLVSKKVTKSAPNRNRIKRHARETYRHLKNSIPISYDYLCISKHPCSTASNVSLKTQLQFLIHQTYDQ